MESASAPQEAAKAPEAEEAGAAEQSETHQQEEQTEAQPVSPPAVATASLEGDSAAKEDEGAAEASATPAQVPKAQPDEEPTPAPVTSDSVSEMEPSVSAPTASLVAAGGMQFPYAGSAGFVAPTPTPIRPLHGDPRALPPGMMRMQTNTSQGMETDAAADNSLNVQPPQLPPTSSMGYAIPASRMFHHPSASPSFYNTTQDGPAPVGPTILDPSFEKQWEATRPAAANAQQDSSTAWSSSDPMQDTSAVNSMTPTNTEPGSVSNALFPPKSLVSVRLDEQTYTIDRSNLSRMVSYAKNATTPGQATALAVDTLRATIDPPPRAHGWRMPFQSDEYEVLLQKGSIGLCMNMSVCYGSVTVTSFRRPENGAIGPAEASGMIQIGDDLIAVDGYIVQSQEDFNRVVSRLKSLRPVLLRFRRRGGAGLETNPDHDREGYRRGMRTSMVGLDNPELFTAGMWNMGVRYISPNRWAAELHVDGGGIRRLGVYGSEKEAAVAYNQFLYRTYGNGAIKFMNPIGSGQSHSSAGGMNSQQPGLPVSISNVRDMKPINRPVKRLLRAGFTNEQKEQLRAQIMVFKFTATGGTIPNELLSRALKSTVHESMQPGSERKKRKTFASHTVTKPLKKTTKKGRKKKQYSDEDDDDDDDEDAKFVPKEPAQPSRRSGRNVGKARKNYVEKENDSDFEFSDEEKPAKTKQEPEGPKGPQIDKIVGIRFYKEAADDDSVDMQFLIKWKDVSYLHVSWLSVQQIEHFGHHSVMRMRRYLQKNSRVVEQARENSVVGKEKDFSAYFSDAYTEVDRILGMKEVEEPENGNPYNNFGAGDDGQVHMKRGKKYLVKWRDLSYLDCTWEWEDELTDDRKIAAYHRYIHPPIVNGAHPAMFNDIRPEPSAWAKYQESPMYNNQNQLRSYQLEGLNWLVFCWYNRRNCILADEMGLGKTVQATAILEHLRQNEHIRGPFLVVAPLVTLGNWKREIETWTTMNCVVYHDSDGGADIRAFIREHEFHYESDAYRKRGIYKFNVLVTSYQTLMADAEYLDSIHWRYVVIDEAHKLKNREAKLLQSLQNFSWDSCLLMTGTPLQNGVFELWCLLNFIEPDKFPSQQEFYDEYGDLNTAEQVARLHEQLRPYMLRRVKEDVEKSIPPKEETIIDVELTTLQKKYYRAIFERNRSFLNMGATGTVANLVNVEMELRKCCNHPFLIRGVEEKECFNSDELYRSKILVQASGKTVLLDKMLTKFRAENKKVLIFSQFKIMLDIIEDLCQLRRYSIERLDGSVRGNSRQAAIDRFNNPESETFAFLLSTRAGGVGINLIAASVVILFDSDWNPQNDLQAVARCHRIGQTQSVNIYRLVTKKTYEAQMFDIASKKLGMHHAVFETGGVRNEFDGEDDDGGNMMSLMSLDREKVEMMIRYGAYAIMGEDDEQDPENRAINELDIDQLLSSSRTIRYDPTGGDNNGDKDGENGTQQPTASQSSALSFSKASFTAEASDSTIDFNDDQFWEKVLGPKPVQLLMTKVQEGALSNASKDDIKKFLEELRELARALVRERQRGGSLADADQILSILIELKVTGPILKNIVNVRHVASDWLEVIERPKRRRNQDVESELMYLEFLDGTKKETTPIGRKSQSGSRKKTKSNGKRRERVAYSSDDDDFEEEEVVPVRQPKKNNRRQSSGFVVQSGIRIALEITGDDFAIQKIESSNAKVQKQLRKALLSDPDVKKAMDPKSKEDRKKKDVPASGDEASDHEKEQEVQSEAKVSEERHQEHEEHDENEEEEEEEVEEEAEEEAEEDEEEEEEDEEEEEEEESDEDQPRQKRREKSSNKRGRKRIKEKGSVDPQMDSEMWCRVCFSDQGFVDDPIVQCEKCAVAVHKYCYGIDAVPDGDTPWYCDFCAQPENANAEAKCALCPLVRPSSAFKQTCEGAWVHVVCALWAPGVQFSDVERMSGVKNVPEAVEETRGPACALCQEKDGCIKCFRGSCLTYFHPLCGRESRGEYDMFMSEGGQLRAFCSKHRSKAKRAS